MTLTNAQIQGAIGGASIETSYYSIPNQRAISKAIPYNLGGYLKQAPIRETATAVFGVETMIDELAYAAGHGSDRVPAAEHDAGRERARHGSARRDQAGRELGDAVVGLEARERERRPRPRRRADRQDRRRRRRRSRSTRRPARSPSSTCTACRTSASRSARASCRTR